MDLEFVTILFVKPIVQKLDMVVKAETGKKREVEDAHMDAHIEIPVFFAPGQLLYVDAAQVKDTAFTPVGLVAGLHLNVDFPVAV